MEIGKLRHRVTIQVEGEVPDGYGGYENGWNDVATVWANVKPKTGLKMSAAVAAGQLLSEVSHVVTIRHRSDLTLKHRLIHKGRIFLIQSIVDPDERGERLEIYCKEVVT